MEARACLWLLWILLAVSLGQSSHLIVNTTTGLIQGSRQVFEGVDYYVFKGIPYAEPPVGALRFSPPQARIPWNGILNATKFGPSCPQDLSHVTDFYPHYVVQIPTEARLTSEENCLTLNIYTPNAMNASSQYEDGRAVVFFIHGGSYETGQGSGYDGSVLAVRGDVVVVTCNYRLNVFGFLGTGDANAPGNYGLLDQQLALQWVHENIVAFGGDPNKVTLFGQSAGADAASLHLFANASRPFFKRVASHSGPISSVFLPPREAIAFTSTRIGQALGCDSTNSSSLVECLRNQPEDKLFSTAARVTSEIGSPLAQYFIPVIDDVFISYTVGYPHLEHDLLISYTSGDGSAILEVAKSIFPDASYNLTKGVTEDQFKKVLGLLLRSDKVSQVATLSEYAAHQPAEDDFTYTRTLTEIMLDLNFFSNLGIIVQTLPRLSSLSMSIFDHRSSIDQRYPGLKRAPHSEELPYVLGLPFSMKSNFNAAERRLSNRLIRYWSNFAKSGDPNVNPDMNTTAQDNGLTYWPEYGEEENYLLIQLNDSKVGQGYRKDKVKFWTDYLPKLSQAAAESCPVPATSASSPTIGKPVCQEMFFGEGLGLKLTAEGAETLIEALVFLAIALVAIVVIVIGAMLGFMYKNRAKKASLKRNGKVKQTNGEINRNSVFEVNEGFITESEDTKM